MLVMQLNTFTVTLHMEMHEVLALGGKRAQAKHLYSDKDMVT